MTDLHQQRAGNEGISRSEAKRKTFAEPYGTTPPTDPPRLETCDGEHRLSDEEIQSLLDYSDKNKLTKDPLIADLCDAIDQLRTSLAAANKRAEDLIESLSLVAGAAQLEIKALQDELNNEDGICHRWSHQQRLSKLRPPVQQALARLTQDNNKETP